MSETMQPKEWDSPTPGWYSDPTRRHAQRYFDGIGFTQDVATAAGAMSLDALQPSDGVGGLHVGTAASAAGGVTPQTHQRGKFLGFFPAWRKITYIVLGFNLLMLIWMMNVSSSAAPGQEAGAGAADIGILFLTALGDVILGVIFLVTRPERSV